MDEGHSQTEPTPKKLTIALRSSQHNRIASTRFRGIPRAGQITQTCSLCQQKQRLRDMVCFGPCGHSFCVYCLQQYCIYKIDVMEEPICPQEHCRGKLKLQGEVHQRLPEESKQRYNRLLLWKQTIGNPHLKLCPTDGCQGLIDTSQGKRHCPACNVTFCEECQLPRHEGPCDSNFSLRFKQMKRCPSCQMFIQRTDGCNHMTCLCGHQFCFSCLEKWNDFHYECGEDDSFEEDQFDISGVAYWKRVFLAAVMLVVLPVVVGMILAFVAVVTVMGPLVGFFLGPVALVVNNNCLQNVFCCVLYPFLTVAGAFMGLFLGLAYSTFLGYQLLRLYLYFVVSLIVVQPPSQSDADGSIYDHFQEESEDS